jgi:serine/threonine protein kinase
MAVSPLDAGSLVGERLGKYHLLALIAIGGTAEIYLARIGGEAGFEKYVVVKCLLDHLADDTEFVRMFLDEARLCAQLDHSNIVQTLELGQHEGRYYMVMEHLAGMSLAQLARKTHERVPEAVIPTRIVLGLAAQACAGLHYAHQRTGSDGSQLNVVHRDVSPQNLVVTFEGMLKIVDFGIAKADLRQTHTRIGTIKGKFAYMSPEQCLAEPIDRRTDVFALGTVVHELLTARRLFKRASTYETYQAILKGNAPPPSRYNDAVDDELDRVVLRALAYDKEDRFESTEAFGEAMLGWLHSRAQSVSASDVARYVEKVCAQEIDEHAAHMRELISGHQIASGESLRWDVAAEEDAESLQLGASPLSSSSLRIDMAPGDYDEAERSAEMAAPGAHELDDDFGGDTRIELDPLERVAAMEAALLAERDPDGRHGDGSIDARLERREAVVHGSEREQAARSSDNGSSPAQPPLLHDLAGLSREEPGFQPGEVPAHEALTAPASDRVSDVRPPSYAEPPRPGPGQMWSDDSAEVLHQGLQAPQPQRPMGGGFEHASRPMMPPPGMMLGAPFRVESAQRQPLPVWILAVAFVLSAGIGLGLTVLIGLMLA